jgi:hypothetical protein
MKTDVILTGLGLAIMMLLFARALMAAWPRVVVDLPKAACGFMPPGSY